MKKYDIVCPIRKANPYKKIIKATLEHATLPNLLNRNFKQDIPGKVLITDITYLFYGNGKKAYLSTIKDGSTNEILAYNISSSLAIDLATDTLHNLMKTKIKLIIAHNSRFLIPTITVSDCFISSVSIGTYMSVSK